MYLYDKQMLINISRFIIYKHCLLHQLQMFKRNIFFLQINNILKNNLKKI